MIPCLLPRTSNPSCKSSLEGGLKPGCSAQAQILTEDSVSMTPLPQRPYSSSHSRPKPV
jgi:hypothetical protein